MRISLLTSIALSACSSPPAPPASPVDRRAGEAAATTAQPGLDAPAWEAFLRDHCEDDGLGCFAWSARLPAAACQDVWGIHFTGDRLRGLDPNRDCASAPATARLLADNAFVPLQAERRRRIAPGETEVAGVMLTWSNPIGEPGSNNAAAAYDHTIVASCARSPGATSVVVVKNRMGAGEGAVWNVGTHLVVSVTANIPDGADRESSIGVYDVSSCRAP